MGLLDWFRRKQSDEPDIIPLPALRPIEPQFWCQAITIDETGLQAVSWRGQESRVDFDDLDRVAIRTTDEGPLVDDVFWVLIVGQQEYLVPQGSPGEAELFDQLIKQKKLDCKVVIEAMTSMHNAEFECWRRPVP